MPAPTIEGLTSILGFGLVRPFQRAAGADFVRAGGERVVRSAIGQIMGTLPGELRWRPTFGTDLERIRHRGMSEEMVGTARALTEGAIGAWEPRISGIATKMRMVDTQFFIEVRWQVVGQGSLANQVLLGPVTQEVVI